MRGWTVGFRCARRRNTPTGPNPSEIRPSNGRMVDGGQLQPVRAARNCVGKGKQQGTQQEEDVRDEVTTIDTQNLPAQIWSGESKSRALGHVFPKTRKGSGSLRAPQNWLATRGRSDAMTEMTRTGDGVERGRLAHTDSDPPRVHKLQSFILSLPFLTSCCSKQHSSLLGVLARTAQPRGPFDRASGRTYHSMRSTSIRTRSAGSNPRVVPVFPRSPAYIHLDTLVLHMRRKLHE